MTDDASKRAKARNTAIARRGPDDDDEQHAMQRSEPAALDFGALLRMGDALAGTGFLPSHIRTGGQAAAIIMAGRELGLAPMRSLRSLKMIKGNVVEDAASQLSRFKKDGGRSTFFHTSCGFKGCTAPVDPTTGLPSHHDEEHASLRLTHPNGDVHVETFTLADAQRGGLLTNDNWRKNPKAMLRSRAITGGLKSVGWEGASNVYDPDEAAHFDEPAPTTTRVVSAREQNGAGSRPQSTVTLRPAKRERTPAEVIVAMLSAVDDAGDDYSRLEAIEDHWVAKVEPTIDDRDWRIGATAYLAIAQAAANGLEYEPSHAELGALSKVRALRDGTAAAHATVPAGDTAPLEADDVIAGGQR